MKKKIFYSVAGGLIILIIIVLMLVLDIGSWVPLDMEKLRTFQQSTVVLDGEGEAAAVLSGSENRINLSLDEIPKHVQNAFIAAEDTRFYRHHGVDLYRIGGALLANIKSGGYDQGASTITQQLIKLTHLSVEKTLARKAQEAWLALQLERRASKDEILEMYLNVVYFGKGAYGIEAAAQAYFGVPAAELTLAQGALLAGVIKSPSQYAPHLHPENALRRRKLVLNAMLEEGFITEPEAQAANEEPLELVEVPDESTQYAWYIDQVISEAEQVLEIQAEDLLSGGYTIYTALNSRMQQSAQSIFLDQSLFPEDASDGTPVQAALVASNVQNGEVVALIGGRKYTVQRGLNRATQIQRQPGSAFKPVSVYAAAVDRFGYLPTSFVQDEQRDFGGGYTPRNVNDNYFGPVTLRQALSRSLNAATVDLLTRVGVDAVREYALASGIALDQQDHNLSLALGSLTYGVSPMDLGAAYAPLANGGQSVEPHLIRKIQNAQGETVYQFQDATQRIMSQESAYLLTDMLCTAAKSGSARALNGLNFSVAAKTGTVAMENGGNRDIWTVAYTPSICTAVWMGFDQPDNAHRLPDSASGSNQPARLIATFFDQNREDLEYEDFLIPNGLREVLIDTAALNILYRPVLASEGTPSENAQPELFYTNDTPTEVSYLWNKPTKVYDVNVQWNSDDMPSICFTAVQSEAVYELYRLSDAGTELLDTLSGEVGQKLSYVDHNYNPSANVQYYVVPVSATLLSEGITLKGDPSSPIDVPQRRTLLNWLENSYDPQPDMVEPISEPLPEADPLF